ncbi:MAG: WYL domain-containing protein, partial [Eubacterium sp.]|nr:WYL domain-containing protein [Eubacterium sp.]
FRKMLYFGDTNPNIQHGNPKHDRSRVINYFLGDKEYYDPKSNTIDFSETERLKELFSEVYSCKAMSTTEMGDSFLLFSQLKTDEFKSVLQMLYGSGRSQKNINRRLDKGGELAESSSIIIQDGKPKKYKKNLDICEGLSDNDKKNLLTAIDFAIKKNPFSAFASTYKNLVSNRDCIDAYCEIEFDHQLFHPILDEFHIWTAISAITDKKNVDIIYCPPDITATDSIDINCVLPLRIVFDNLYGRSFLVVFDYKYNNYSTLRFDRIYHMEIANSANPLLFEEKRSVSDKKLETAWLIDLFSEPQTVKLEFINDDAVYNRVVNEGRHGVIDERNETSFTFIIDVNNPREMINWILSFGEYCKVIEPTELQKEIIVKLEAMVNAF